MDPHMLDDMDPPMLPPLKPLQPEAPKPDVAKPDTSQLQLPKLEAFAKADAANIASSELLFVKATATKPDVAISDAAMPDAMPDATMPSAVAFAASLPKRRALLDVEGLAMRFGGLTAVDGLSFTARSGEITALIGPNGAGKTTVFNCITGFYRPASGAIRLHPPGESGPIDLHRLKDFEITSKARVARTFQNIRLFSGMTVLENLMVAQHRRLTREAGPSFIGVLRSVFGGRKFKAAERAGVARAVAWLDRIGLTQRADDPAGDLPYGDQRRLEIARAMLTEPLLLCLDEPAAGLNPRESADLAALLRMIRDELGTAILLIEHDMSVVMDISDHIIVLEYGRRIADGTPDQIRNDPNVIKAYLGVEHDVMQDDAR
jgi:branched-chain amino acid transport system ATP-binding protein